MADDLGSPVAQMLIEATDGGSLMKLAEQVVAMTQKKNPLTFEFNWKGDIAKGQQIGDAIAASMAAKIQKAIQNVTKGASIPQMEKFRAKGPEFFAMQMLQEKGLGQTGKASVPGLYKNLTKIAEEALEQRIALAAEAVDKAVANIMRHGGPTQKAMAKISLASKPVPGVDQQSAAGQKIMEAKAAEMQKIAEDLVQTHFRATKSSGAMRGDRIQAAVDSATMNAWAMFEPTQKEFKEFMTGIGKAQQHLMGTAYDVQQEFVQSTKKAASEAFNLSKPAPTGAKEGVQTAIKTGNPQILKASFQRLIKERIFQGAGKDAIENEIKAFGKTAGGQAEESDIQSALEQFSLNEKKLRQHLDKNLRQRAKSIAGAITEDIRLLDITDKGFAQKASDILQTELQKLEGLPNESSWRQRAIGRLRVQGTFQDVLAHQGSGGLGGIDPLFGTQVSAALKANEGGNQAETLRASEARRLKRIARAKLNERVLMSPEERLKSVTSTYEGSGNVLQPLPDTAASDPSVIAAMERVLEGAVKKGGSNQDAFTALKMAGSTAGLPESSMRGVFETYQEQLDKLRKKIPPPPTAMPPGWKPEDDELPWRVRRTLKSQSGALGRTSPESPAWAGTLNVAQGALGQTIETAIPKHRGDVTAGKVALWLDKIKKQVQDVKVTGDQLNNFMDDVAGSMTRGLMGRAGRVMGERQGLALASFSPERMAEAIDDITNRVVDDMLKMGRDADVIRDAAEDHQVQLEQQMRMLQAKSQQRLNAFSPQTLRSRMQQRIDVPGLFGVSAEQAARDEAAQMKSELDKMVPSGTKFDQRTYQSLRASQEARKAKGLGPGQFTEEAIQAQEAARQRAQLASNIHGATTPYTEPLSRDPQTIQHMAAGIFEKHMGSSTQYKASAQQSLEAYKAAEKGIKDKIQSDTTKQAAITAPPKPGDTRPMPVAGKEKEWDEIASQIGHSNSQLILVQANIAKIAKLQREINDLAAKEAKIRTQVATDKLSPAAGAKKLEALAEQSQKKMREIQALADPGMKGIGGDFNMNFAMMQAAYGFQDFFQVLAQPGMGTMRAFLAAANNIGPAMYAMGVSGVAANTAVGVLLATMVLGNVIIGKEEDQFKDLEKSIDDVTKAFENQQLARMALLTATIPSGAKSGREKLEQAFESTRGFVPKGTVLSQSAERTASLTTQKQFSGSIRTTEIKNPVDDAVVRGVSDLIEGIFDEIMVGLRTTKHQFDFRKPRIDDTEEKMAVPEIQSYAQEMQLHPEWAKAPVYDKFREVGRYDRVVSIGEAQRAAFFDEKTGKGKEIIKHLADIAQKQSELEDSRRLIEEEPGRLAVGLKSARKLEVELGPIAGRGIARDFIQNARGEQMQFTRRYAERAEEARQRKEIWEKQNEPKMTWLQSQVEDLNKIEQRVIKAKNVSEFPAGFTKFSQKEGTVGGLRNLKEERDRFLLQLKPLNEERKLFENEIKILQAGVKTSAEIQKALGMPSGRTTMIESGNVWDRIQASLISDPAVQVAEQQLNELQRIRAAVEEAAKQPAKQPQNGPQKPGIEDWVPKLSPLEPLGNGPQKPGIEDWVPKLSPLEPKSSFSFFEDLFFHGRLPFAKGGFAPEQPKGTDTVPAMLTPGEVVLNAAQQSRLGMMFGGSANDVFGSIGVPGFSDGGVLSGEYAGLSGIRKTASEDLQKSLRETLENYSQMEVGAFHSHYMRSGLSKRFVDAMSKSGKSVNVRDIEEAEFGQFVRRNPTGVPVVSGDDHTGTHAVAMSGKSHWNTLGLGKYAVANHEFEHFRSPLLRQKFRIPGQSDPTAEIPAVLGDLVFQGKIFQDQMKKSGVGIPDFGQDFPSGRRGDINWMVNKGKEHGYFEGRTMTELLGTQTGRQYLRSILDKKSLDDPHVFSHMELTHKRAEEFYERYQRSIGKNEKGSRNLTPRQFPGFASGGMVGASRSGGARMPTSQLAEQRAREVKEAEQTRQAQMRAGRERVADRKRNQPGFGSGEGRELKFQAVDRDVASGKISQAAAEITKKAALREGSEAQMGAYTAAERIRANRMLVEEKGQGIYKGQGAGAIISDQGSDRYNEILLAERRKEMAQEPENFFEMLQKERQMQTGEVGVPFESKREMPVDLAPTPESSREARETSLARKRARESGYEDKEGLKYAPMNRSLVQQKRPNAFQAKQAELDKRLAENAKPFGWEVPIPKNRLAAGIGGSKKKVWDVAQSAKKEVRQAVGSPGEMAVAAQEQRLGDFNAMIAGTLPDDLQIGQRPKPIPDDFQKFMTPGERALGRQEEGQFDLDSYAKQERLLGLSPFLKPTPRKPPHPSVKLIPSGAKDVSGQTMPIPPLLERPKPVREPGVTQNLPADVAGQRGMAAMNDGSKEVVTAINSMVQTLGGKLDAAIEAFKEKPPPMLMKT